MGENLNGSFEEFSTPQLNSVDLVIPSDGISTSPLSARSTGSPSATADTLQSTFETTFFSENIQDFYSRRGSAAGNRQSEVLERVSASLESVKLESTRSEDPRLTFQTNGDSGPFIQLPQSSSPSAEEDDDTVFNFSMHVKSKKPAARPDEQDKDFWDNVYEKTRYRPQVLINDWDEVTQRLELNKGRHLKLQKGPHQSAYDNQFQHPFAKKLSDPEECARKRNTRSRNLWTYLAHPTEYSEHFNEPYRKK